MLTTLDRTVLSPATLVGDPDLRAALPAAVLARPDDDLVGSLTWRLVADALEASSHAVHCGTDGTHPAVVAVLAHEAENAATTAYLALRGIGARRHVQPPAIPPAPGSVEQTWTLVARMLFQPSPVLDLPALLTGLDDHRKALHQWQRVLRAPGRLAMQARSA